MHPSTVLSNNCGHILILMWFGLLKFQQNGVPDTSNFNEEFTREQPTLTPVHGQLTAQGQA